MKNLDHLDRLMRLLLAFILFFAVSVLFTNLLAKVLISAAALFSLWEAAVGRCYLTKYLGSKSVSDRLTEKPLYLLGLVAIQLVLAYEWWSAGWEKLSGGEFVKGIKGTLAFFASKNPFTVYKEFLLGFASDNSTAFAYSVEWSQMTVAVLLVLFGALLVYSKNVKVQRISLILSVAALLGGIVMNANFYLAAGWTGPGTQGINVVMFWIEAVLVYIWLYHLGQTKHAG